ncbi:MAG: DNA polymerase ligase N-terminal domain-containing protein [Solirubrobacterales bacterium]
MAERLSEYRRKRDFARTPEPEGSAEESAAGGRFVVQQHDATNLHWDLRLEHDGVALSWALPRGVPQLPDRSANRLAVRTEDHPLSYLDFEGEIPTGEYGGGTMSIWDSGTYSAEKLRDDEMIAEFVGERMRGRYALFRTGGKNWMIHRIDPPLDSRRTPLPGEARPMLYRRGALPEDPGGWGFEIAWGGLRSLLWCEPGHILRSRSRGLDAETVTVFPELRRIARVLGSVEALLDGEIVVLGQDGVPDPERLRARKRAGSEAVAKRLVRTSPAAIMLFDLLFCDGRDLTEEPYTARRKALEGLGLDGAAWQTPAYHHGDGAALLEAARERGLDGIVAKRLGSPYREGRRSQDWIKVEA